MNKWVASYEPTFFIFRKEKNFRFEASHWFQKSSIAPFSPSIAHLTKILYEIYLIYTYITC